MLYNIASMADKKLYTLGVRVDEATYKVLEKYAQGCDRTVSYLVRKIVTDWIKAEEPQLKIAEQEGKYQVKKTKKAG